MPEDASNRTTADPPRDLLAIGEAARLLGRSVRTLYGWAATGRIPCYRDPTDGRRYFRRADVLAVAPQLVSGAQS